MLSLRFTSKNIRGSLTSLGPSSWPVTKRPILTLLKFWRELLRDRN